MASDPDGGLAGRRRHAKSQRSQPRSRNPTVSRGPDLRLPTSRSPSTHGPSRLLRPRHLPSDPVPIDDAQPVAEESEEIGRSPWATWDDEPAAAEARDAGVPESTQVFPTTWEPPAPPVREPAGALEPAAGDIRTRLAERGLDLDEDAEGAPSTAEQAVPWLIGFILLLAGMVIVLLALIFAGDESLGAGRPTGSGAGVGGLPSDSPAPSASALSTAAVPSASPIAGPPSATPVPTATPIPIPEYGPLEMTYQGRAAALAPIYLLRHDFTTSDDPSILAQDPALDVRRFAWEPAGASGAGLLADVLVSIEPGQEKRRLGDGIMTITFGDDGAQVYAVRITQDGANDIATVLRTDFASGDTTELASITYARPETAARPPLLDAQFADDGGLVRLVWTEADVLHLWAEGAGAWEITPDEGEVTEVADALPTLWSPDGRQRIDLDWDDGTTIVNMVDTDADTIASTTIEGILSHIRWSPDGDRIVFTLGRSAAGGGVLQDLFLWDLGDGEAPMQLTSTGAAFGAEWLGSQPRWRP